MNGYFMRKSIKNLFIGKSNGRKSIISIFRSWISKIGGIGGNIRYFDRLNFFFFSLWFYRVAWLMYKFQTVFLLYVYFGLNIFCCNDRTIYGAKYQSQHKFITIFYSNFFILMELHKNCYPNVVKQQKRK